MARHLILLTGLTAGLEAVRFKSFLKHFLGKMSLFGNGFAALTAMSDASVIGCMKHRTKRN
jgi:hypothetical protein